MDKKNTLLLTVIAVATLLVAVVGATFAFFSVNNTSQTASTTVTANAGKIGTVTVNGSSASYVLNVTAEDMKEPDSADEKYYAINAVDVGSAVTTGGKYSTIPTDLVVGDISVENIAETDKVSCDISVQVTLSGTMAGVLEKGDLFLSLSGLGLTGGTEDLDVKDTASKFNFETGSGIATFTGTLELTNSKQKDELKAKLWLVNKKASSQNNLAGKGLSAKIDITASDCVTTSTGAGA